MAVGTRIDRLEKSALSFDNFIGTGRARFDKLEKTTERFDELDVAVQRIDVLEANGKRVELNLLKFDEIDKNMKGYEKHMGTNNKRIHTLENFTARIEDLET